MYDLQNSTFLVPFSFRILALFLIDRQRLYSIIMDYVEDLVVQVNEGFIQVVGGRSCNGVSMK